MGVKEEEGNKSMKTKEREDPKWGWRKETGIVDKVDNMMD